MMLQQHSWLLVACAAVALSSRSPCVFATASASQAAATQNLIEWIRSKEGGIYNPKQEETNVGKINSSRGIFASEDIDEGEILLKVPWDSIIGAKGATYAVLKDESKNKAELMDNSDDLEDLTLITVTACRAIRDLYHEVQKGETSDFAPHLRYLSLLDDDGSDSDPVMPVIPSMWSEDGKSLLEDINDHGSLPPFGLLATLNHDWYGACIEDLQNSPLEVKVASVVAAHGSSGEILSEYGMIVPLFDNYHYNQRQVGHERSDDHVNAKGIVDYGDSFRLVATRSIKKGEQIARPFGNYEHTEFMTPDIFRDYGIADDIYPKFYEFAVYDDGVKNILGSFGLEVDSDDETASLSVEFVEIGSMNDDDNEIKEFLAEKLNRLQRVQTVAMRNGLPKTSTITQREWDTAWSYHRDLVEAISLGLHTIGKENTGDDEDDSPSCPGGRDPTSAGTCPIWDGFERLPNRPIVDLDLEYNPGPRGPTEDAYEMCNDDPDTYWDTYVIAGDVEIIKSQYQEIFFFTDPQTEDMVMKLDNTVQQCSSYRPHYHEFAVHYPSRFLESVKRVLFVGGGDSMVLHEVLKYPSLERVVGLELDQYVLRNSFRYFNTQPHFDDKRVEWWFGDGAKSLLMLPKDYFQSFDLVVVDLSETVMSFQVTDKLSIFQTLSLLLKPDGIMLKNGEYYMDKMSKYFDNTLLYFEFDIPFICDQGMVIGSNSIDFFNRTIKDHGVELLVLESQDEINEKFNEFYRFTELRKNDARKQGQCEDEDDDDDFTEEGSNAGILMVVEAENVTYDLKSSEAVEKTIILALKNLGFSIVSAVKHESSTIVIVMKEGYVSARLFPEQSYVALDFQLWASFDLLERARDDVVQSLGGTEESTSSFRIVTGGMSGSSFQESDRSKIGPRMVNDRDCKPPSSPAPDDNNVDLVESGVEGSLEMLEDGVFAAVICGAKEEPCKSLDVLQKAPHSKIQKVVPVYTCASLQSSGAEFSPDIAKKMAACEAELVDALISAGDKISLLVVDDSAKQIMGKVLLAIFTSVWNRKTLFAQHRFVALVENSSTDAWRRNLLVLIREKVTFRPMSLVDVVVESSANQLNLSMLSLHDPVFFLHLKGMVETYNQVHGATSTMKVESVFDGLVLPTVGKLNPKWFKADDYDPTPGKEQLAGQTSLGRQSLVQFEISSIVGVEYEVTISVLEGALTLAIGSKEDLKFTSFVGKDAGIGDGLIVVAFSSDGAATHAIAAWDGKTHIDVNLFSGDENPKLRETFINAFPDAFGLPVPVQLTLSDTHPRGTGRVVSFPGHVN